MDIERLLRWIIVAIVAIVAIVLLNAVLNLVGFLLRIALPVLLILLGIAIVLRFIGMLRNRR